MINIVRLCDAHILHGHVPAGRTSTCVRAGVRTHRACARTRQEGGEGREGRRYNAMNLGSGVDIVYIEIITPPPPPPPLFPPHVHPARCRHATCDYMCLIFWPTVH